MQGFIGFDGVPFTIRASDDEAVYPDWDQEHDDVLLRIYDSNVTVVQHMGAGLATWRVTLSFASMEDYLALRARQTATGVLTIYAGYTSARGTEYHFAGKDFEDLDETELVRLFPARIGVGKASIEADALFRRAMDPLTGRAQ